MNDLVLMVLGVLGALYFIQKNRAIEAQAENLETKEKLADVDKDLSKLESALEIEEQKRKSAKEEMEKTKDESLSGKDIADFFNDHK